MGLALSILVVSVAAGFGGSAVQAISLSVETVGNGQLRLSCPANEGSHLLESTDALGGAWTTVDGAFEEANGQRQRSMVADAETRFLRLRRTKSIPVTIKESSPASGETGVAVTRETILRLTDSLASDTVLGTNQVYAGASGRRLLSGVALSQDRRTVTLFYLEPMPSDARVDVIFDGTGIFDAANLPVDAFIGFVPSPDMGPLGSCLNGGAQSVAQAVRDCGIDPKGCRETVATKILDFSMEIRTAPGFTPALGQEITLFMANAVAGRFTEVTGLELPDSRRYRVLYDSKTIRLRVE